MQSLNTESSIFLIDVGKLISERLEHPKNVDFETFVNDFGNFTWVNAVHPSKTFSPMPVKLDGSFIWDNDVHFLKTLFPILEIDWWNETSVNEAQHKKNELGIFFKDAGILKFDKKVHD